VDDELHEGELPTMLLEEVEEHLKAGGYSLADRDQILTGLREGKDEMLYDTSNPQGPCLVITPVGAGLYVAFVGYMEGAFK
jgi:hypothetical protein